MPHEIGRSTTAAGALSAEAENTDMPRMFDLHAHVVPGVDDGADSPAMAAELLQMAVRQGVTDMVCTSHSWGISRHNGVYWRGLRTLRQYAAEHLPGLRLHSGCEIACSQQTVWEVIGLLETGAIHPLCDSRYLLVEFDPYAPPEEIAGCFRTLKAHTGYRFILAHAERCHRLADAPDVLEALAETGVLLQLNAFSLVQEHDERIRGFARQLLAQERADFLGSDCHRTGHRPPAVAQGLAYIRENCRAEYAHAVCCGNARRLLLRSNPPQEGHY
ncbi:MAG: hypothetical protein IJ343_04070 [Clostridia bacterium]|nr:hypothetical protein [Clostridia bacterium]